MKKNILCALLAIVLLSFLCVPIYADTEGTSSGTATVGNAAPTVTNPGLWNAGETADANNTNLDVYTEYRINCTVTDNNQLYDLLNVTFIIWEDNEVDETSADANANHYTFDYLNSTDAFDEIGPDGGGNSHLVSANCTKPADRTQVSGVYKLAWKLHKTGNYTGSVSWKIKIIAYDSSSSANVQTLIFGVNAYYEMTVDDASHGWTGLSAGNTDVQLTTPVDGDIDVTVTANNGFKLQAKGSADLASGDDTIGLGNVTIHEDTLGSSVALTTGYADIGGLISETRGESQAKSFILWIDVPNGTPAGSYTYTLTAKVLAA